MQTTLAAAVRRTRGKNEARRLRRAERLPAVVYGGTPVESLALELDPKAVLRILHSESGVNTLVDLQIDGGAAERVLIKDVQHDPVYDRLLHVDFFRLAMDKAITVTVPVTLSGEAVGVKQQGGLLDFVTREFQIECMPAEIPEHIDIDVRELAIGDAVRIRDVAEEAGWKPVSDLDTLLVHVTVAKTGADDDEDEDAAEDVEDAEAGADEDGSS